MYVFVIANEAASYLPICGMNLPWGIVVVAIVTVSNTGNHHRLS